MKTEMYPNVFTSKHTPQADIHTQQIKYRQNNKYITIQQNKNKTYSEDKTILSIFNQIRIAV